MKKKQKILEKIPLDQSIIEKIIKNGGKIYLVGGACRDFLLGKEPADFDFSVIEISQKKFKDLFPQATLVGSKFPVFLLDGYEFSINTYSIEDDLKTRDFTFNALAINLKTAKIIDPFKGRKDLKNKKIRALPESIYSDPLRAYRAARFVSQLSTDSKQFEIVQETLKQMKQVKNELKGLTRERVFEELRKVLNSQYPDLFFKVLDRTNILEVHFKEISYKKTFKISLKAIKEAVKETNDETLRFAVLVHKLSSVSLLNLCQRIKIPVRWQKAAKTVIREFEKASTWKNRKPEQIVKLFYRLKRSPLKISGMVTVIKCVAVNNHKININEVEEMVGFAQKLFNEVDGSCLKGLKEGPKFGEELLNYQKRWVKKNI